MIFSEGIFKCLTNFAHRHIPREAGFTWNAKQKTWYTPYHGTAARLEAYCDESAMTELQRKSVIVDPWQGSLSVPTNESLMPFQEQAARFALARDKSYLALDPGLGKTPVAAVIAQTLHDKSESAWLVVYICPPFLTRNTAEEFKRWTKNVHLTVVPDSMITKDEVKERIRLLTVKAHLKQFRCVLFVDEAHRFKTLDAKRTQSLFGFQGRKGIADHFDKIIYLSGTPMPNRPIELWPVLHHSASELINRMGKMDYAQRYCAAFYDNFGWDMSGNSNMLELANRILNKFMLRYKKLDVLKDLPPKLEEVVTLEGDLNPKLMKSSHMILEKFPVEDLMKGKIQLELEKDILHLSTYRKELGILKAKPAAEFIKYILDETDESLLVFAIHKEVIATLELELSKYWPLVITGETRMELRHEIVKTFQTDNRRRLFIGNINAAGIGLTLTKATRVLFVEFSWVPAENDQAADRAHRIGQDERVLVQYLVHQNSVDNAVIKTILRKKKVTEKI